MTRSFNSRLLWPYIAILALTVIFFYKLVFTGMILGRGDIYAYFYPYWTVQHAALLAGHVPLWTPDIFMGVPLLANSQVGLLYPINLPLTPFDTPTAISISLLIHIAWAMIGVYTLARSALKLDQTPALLAALVFGLGGYMGAKVENINQLQALAWMPWMFLLLGKALSDKHLANTTRHILLLGIVLALQLLAGHPQTVFITLLGLGVYGLTLAAMESPNRARNILRLAFILVAVGLIGVILAAPQLIPTLELSGESNRSGGLNIQQAMAFSLNPFVIGRGMLPSYDGLLFGEYIGYIGIIGLGLAVIGIVNPSLKKGLGYRLPWIILAILGFGLALGLYNPIYWTLASLPGFSFFRVPARWLALFALAAAMLAGIGLQSLKVKRPALWMIALVVLLVGGLAAATSITGQMAVDVIGPAEPTSITWIGWGLALAAFLVALVLPRRISERFIVPVMAVLTILELFAASRVLAYNAVLPPDTYNAQRFTISQLHAYNAGQSPPGRMLGISQLLFDPGDVTALTARYRGLGMSDLAIRLALVDTKMRELVAPNLPLAWGIPSIDGFDGGLLPTENYSAFTSLMLPPGESPSVDGRLREMLAREECLGACIPDLRWLNLTNTRHVIIDKVFDIWQDDVAYDTGLAVLLDISRIYANPIAFEADSVDILYTGDQPPDIVYMLDGDDIALEGATADSLDDIRAFHLMRFHFDVPLTVEQVTVQSPDAPLTVQAVTLVDTRTGDFQQLTPSPWERILSSDIKLYENQAVLPRAFLVSEILTASDTDSALVLLREPSFDPATTAVLIHSTIDGQLPPKGEGESAATITAYTPERVEIQVESAAEQYLLLTDAYYPGWTATVNGQTAAIERADVMFRAVRVPAGTSRVVFEYRPGWWPGILVFGAAAWLIGLLALTGLIWRERRSVNHTADHLSAH